MTKEIIYSIITPSGKISKTKVKEYKLKSKYFDSEEKLFEYIIINEFYNKDMKITNICEKCDCETKFDNLIMGYKNLCKQCARKKTCLEKYGTETYNNPDKMTKTKIENDSYTAMVKTHKATCLEKYGVEHHWLSEEIQDNKKQNFIDKYGVENPMQIKEVVSKVKATNLEKYGFENVSHNEEVKDKIRNAQLNLTDEEKLIKEQKRKNTCVNKYGVEHIAQTGIHENSGFKWKEYKTPNSNILKVQGYEPKLLDELLLEYSEDDIIVERRNMPEIWYIGTDNKQHRYFPDIYIPSINTIYEVKSDYTLNLDLETNLLKFQAVKDAGYNFILKVY